MSKFRSKSLILLLALALLTLVLLQAAYPVLLKANGGTVMGPNPTNLFALIFVLVRRWCYNFSSNGTPAAHQRKLKQKGFFKLP